jgi:membrane associated rhomboid family serine protease
MGIYDREYYQEREPGLHFGGSRMMVTNLVIINVAIYVMNLFVGGDDTFGTINHALALKSNLLEEPWQCYELLTYGFAHSRTNIVHILGNMFCLWFFGRDIEPIYGRKTFLGFYLTAIILAGLIGRYAEEFLGDTLVILIGASGGVAAVIIVYIFHFPRRTLLIWGILPMPAWALGVMFLVMDFLGTFSSDSNVAHSAHLAGAAYGFLFYRTRWELGQLIPGPGWLKRFKARPQVRIHRPQEDEGTLSAEVDRILEKIGREGESSLTKKERDTLEYASRRYQQKHR